MENTPTWNIEQVWGSDRFYHEGDVAEGQIAFVIDSGIAKLDDLNVNEEWSKSFVDGFPDPFEDITGHGTAVASIIGAKANYEGLTGVAPGAELVALRVFGDRGWARGRDIEAALQYAKEVIVENNLQDRAVVNMSLGGGQPSNHPLVEEMADLGIKFAVAAGNSGRDVDGFSPASYGHHENVYVASSNTEDGEYSWFTNFDGLDLNGIDDSDFVAPGSRITTYNTDGTVRFRNGTSFSAPHLAGVLLMSEKVRPGQTFEMSEDQVEKGMIPDPLGMFDPYTYKHGPSTGDPTPEPPPESLPPGPPEPIVIEVPGPVVEVPIYIEVPGPVVEVPVPGPVVEVPVPVPGPVVEVPVPVPGPVVEVPVPGPVVEVPVPGPVVEVPVPEPYPVPVPVDPIIGDWNQPNRIFGTVEDDAIYGGSKKDVIKGLFGNDTIVGFGGNDSLKGGRGDDLIFGGQGGKTKMTGGEGADTFFLSGGEGYSVIKDFDATEDKFICPFEYELTYGNNITKLWVEDDLVAKFKGIFTEL